MMPRRQERAALVQTSMVDVDVIIGFGSVARQQHDRNGPWRPPTEVYETSSELVVRVDIAGIAIDAIEVVVLPGRLDIRGERVVAPCDARRIFHESRISYGPFLAAVRVPCLIDEQGASAEYVDGVLTVRLPRLNPTTIVMRDTAQTIEAERGE